MANLYRVICTIDVIGRPHHNLVLLFTSDSHEELVKFQDKDIENWQRSDMLIREEVSATWAWTCDQFRCWEMQRNTDEMRCFVCKFTDGFYWSLSYQVLS